MRIKVVKPFARECSHEETVAVRSVGVERIVCEKCGHISFSFDGDIPSEAADDQFVGQAAEL